jgi:hypothetical protein
VIVLVVRTIVTADPAIRANVIDALSGPGAPAGIVACFERDDVVSVRFDDEITPAELIDDLITIESHFVPGGASADPGDSEIARLASVGLADPDIDAGRILERHLVGLE